MTRLNALAGLAAIAAALGAADLAAQEPRHVGEIDFEGVIAGARAGGRQGNPMQAFNALIAGADKVEGLFTLYKKGDHLYAELPMHQLNQPLLVPVTVARGMGMTGFPVTRSDEMVLIFRRVGDRIQVVRRNIHYKATPGTPLDKAVKQNYTDSILIALPILATNPMRGAAALVDFSDIFFTDFAQLGLGPIDRTRTSWAKAKGFPNNMELEVEATFAGSGPRGSMDARSDGVADRRGITVVLHYSLMRAPGGGYRPRLADDRVGHFLSANKDFAVTDPDSSFVRMINRWRLEKAVHGAKLSPPRKQIVWYIEDTVPIEYRPYVEEGIREWNKAFEKIGFKDAIAVRWEEPGRDEFDPEDTNYCTFRWVAGDSGGAMSCMRANPMTGELIDGDVIFDAGFIRAWKQEYALLIGSKTTADGHEQPAALALGEIVSPILASKMGFGQPATGQLLGLEALDRNPDRLVPEVIPADQNPLAWELARRASRSNWGLCELQSGMQRDLAMVAMSLADGEVAAQLPVPPPPTAPSGGPFDDKKPEKLVVLKGDSFDLEVSPADKALEAQRPGRPGGPRGPQMPPAVRPQPKDELPEEFVGQAIKHIVMHEVGHSLGLRHNFKASTMLSADQLHDTAITHSKGLVGSVMDYSPINIAPKGKKQGDYYSTTIGPYDYWAIEYAYKPIDGDEASELKKIASRAPEHDLVYSTDEDALLNDDPYVNRWDLGSDPCDYGKSRIELAEQLLKDLDARVVKDGDSWSRTRRGFQILLQQWGDGATLASQFIGGHSVSRDHKADKDARDPIVPVAGAKQRECLKFLVNSILSDQAFQFSPALLRRLGAERWMHWGSSAMSGPSVDISVLERILAIQKIVLSHCLAPGTLARLQNQQLQANPGADPLRMEEVFRSLTDGVWSDLDRLGVPHDEKAPKPALSIIRRNLQREYLKRLSGMVLGNGVGSTGDRFVYVLFVRGGETAAPADARALARLHLKEISGRITRILETGNLVIDDTTRAHLEECRHRIAKVLEAHLDAREP